MPRTQAIFFTWTTYGTWLRGDMRGWVDDGIVLPADPCIEAADRARMKHTVFTFHPEQLLSVGQAMGDSLRSRMKLRILALTIQTWHVHLVVAATSHSLSDIVKCAKDAVRWHLRLDRPLWTVKFDKRFCFSPSSTRSRVDYVERHNVRVGLPARPWAFIE
jgi:REP element-mobilizing transposase RayT